MAQNWSFINSGTVATGANPSPALPSGWQQGDLLLIVAGSTTVYSATPPTGYTQAAREASTGFGGLAVWWKAAGSSESAPALTNASTTSKAVMMAYRKVNTSATDKISAIGTGGSGSASAASVTTTANDDLVLHMWTCTTGTAGTWTNPSGTTVRVNSGNTTTLVGILTDDEDQAAAGATTARTGTTNHSIGVCGVTIAFLQTADVTYALTHETVTSSNGTVSLEADYYPTAQTFTSSEGSVTLTSGYAITAETATFSEGTIGPEADYGITAETVIFTEGTITATQGTVYALTAQSVISSEGTIGGEADYGITAQSSSLIEGIIGGEVDYLGPTQTSTWSEGTITVQTGGDVTLSITALEFEVDEGIIISSGGDGGVTLPHHYPPGFNMMRMGGSYN